MISKYISKLLAITILIAATTSCVGVPETAVKGKPTRNTDGLGSDEEITAMALKFEGKDALNRKCDLYITLLEDDHEHEKDHHHDEEEEHHILMKLDYKTLDGHTPSASESVLYQYDFATGIYTEEDLFNDDTSLVLLGMSLKEHDEHKKEKEEELDPNLINTYIAESELEQFVRVKFTENSIGDNFIEELEEALESAKTDRDLSQFDKVEKVDLGIAHGDHYHFPNCSNYTPVGIVETKFEFGHEHEHEEE